jgi:hypothetical protein
MSLLCGRQSLHRDVNIFGNHPVHFIFARRWDPSSENGRVLLGLCEYLFIFLIG